MKRLITAGAALGLAAIMAVSPDFGSAQSTASWNTFHGDSPRDGQSTLKGPTTGMKVGQWTLPAPIESSVVVDAKGNAYVGDDNNIVYALNTASPGIVSAGNPKTIRWSFATGGPVKAVPSLSPDGSKLFVGSEDGKVYGLNTADGSKAWAVDLGGPVEGSPLPSNDGSTVYASNINGTIMALNTSDGSVKWKIATNNAIRGSLTLSPDGSTVYAVLSSSGAIDGFAASGPTSAGSSTPSVIFNPSGPPISTPSVDSNGNIYVTTAYGTVESFAAGGGAARWTFIIPNHFPAASTPAISGGNVYFGAGNGNIYAISQSSGQQVWQLHTNAPVESSPAVAGGNGIVYVGSDDGNLYAVNGTTGVAAWIRLLGGYVTPSPAIGPDGSVWIGSQGGGVFRFLDVGLPPPPGVPTPGPSPTPASTSTPGPTATSAPPTATATAVATTTPTTLPLTIAAKTSVKPGASQVVTITSAPNTLVHLRVDYANGDHQSHKVTTSATGTATYTYVQSASKITRTLQTATITATVGSGASQAKQTAQYTVKFGAIDVSAQPRAVTMGQVVNIYVHTKKRTPVVAYVTLRSGHSATLRGTTGAKGFAHLKLKVKAKLFRHGQKAIVQANLVRGRAYTKTFFTVK